MHGGSAPQVKQAARERLMALQNPAIDAMTWLINQREFPTVTFAASRDILDRTEGKAIETVNANLTGDIVIRHELADSSNV
jgi:hypothetical protein